MEQNEFASDESAPLSLQHRTKKNPSSLSTETTQEIDLRLTFNLLETQASPTCTFLLCLRFD